jgi:hypothetical protein
MDTFVYFSKEEPLALENEDEVSALEKYLLELFPAPTEWNIRKL